MSATTGPANTTYVNPAGFPSDKLPNQGYRLWLAIVIMIISSGAFVIARIATRLSTHQMGFDDYAIIAAFVSLFFTSRTVAVVLLLISARSPA